jgi:hypothetical protein
LHLAGALAAAAEFDRAAADQSLAAAGRVAEQIGADRNDHWTAFGPTNVRIHQISAAVAFGDANMAVETGEALDLQNLPAGLAGRRSQVSLDLARGYAQQRHDAAAVNMLLDAERAAPQLVRYPRCARLDAPQGTPREHSPAPAAGPPRRGDLTRRIAQNCGSAATMTRTIKAPYPRPG